MKTLFKLIFLGLIVTSVIIINTEADAGDITMREKWILLGVIGLTSLKILPS